MKTEFKLRPVGDCIHGQSYGARQFAAARLVHRLAVMGKPVPGLTPEPATRPATAWGYLDATNAAQALDGGWLVRLVRAFPA